MNQAGIRLKWTLQQHGYNIQESRLTEILAGERVTYGDVFTVDDQLRRHNAQPNPKIMAVLKVLDKHNDYTSYEVTQLRDKIKCMRGTIKKCPDDEAKVEYLGRPWALPQSRPSTPITVRRRALSLGDGTTTLMGDLTKVRRRVGELEFAAQQMRTDYEQVLCELKEAHQTQLERSTKKLDKAKADLHHEKEAHAAAKAMVTAAGLARKRLQQTLDSTTSVRAKKLLGTIVVW